MGITADILKYIADVKTAWSLAAFAIAVLLVMYRDYLRRPNSSTKKVMWVIVGVTVLLVFAPIGTDAYLQIQKAKLNSAAIYRVRVTVVDDHQIPVANAAVRITAANEVKTAVNGDAELAVPKGGLPRDGKVTIFAEKDSAFQHGRRELSLGDDLNPSVIIPVTSDRTAGVSGAVQDEAGRRLSGVRVSIPGTPAVDSDADGNFRIKNVGSRGQKVMLHAERAGYKTTSQYHPVGEEPAILVLVRQHR